MLRSEVLPVVRICDRRELQSCAAASGQFEGDGRSFGRGTERPRLWSAGIAFDLKLTNQPDHLLGLLLQALTGSRRLLDHRGVLLSYLVHLIDGGVHLIEARRLLLCRSRNFGD